MKQAIIPGLVAVLGFVVAAGATYGFRLSRLEPEVHALDRGLAPMQLTPKQLTPRRTRIRPVRAECPGGLDGFEPQLAEINAEAARVRAEVRGTQSRAEQMGQAWPVELNQGIEPETVRQAVAALIPDDALVEWSCEAVPCTAVVVLPGADSERATQLRSGIEARFPGSSEEVHQVEAGQLVAGYALHFQVMPELVEPAHEQRAYYLSRHPRKAVMEAMRARLRSAEP